MVYNLAGVKDFSFFSYSLMKRCYCINIESRFNTRILVSWHIHLNIIFSVFPTVLGRSQPAVIIISKLYLDLSIFQDEFSLGSLERLSFRNEIIC